MGYTAYLETLPLVASPEVFGMHENANISYANDETFSVLGTALLLEAGGGGGGGGSGGVSREEMVIGTAKAIEDKLPAEFKMHLIEMAYPVMYSESMNTVLG